MSVRYKWSSTSQSLQQSVSFEVDPVKPAQQPLTEVSYAQAIKHHTENTHLEAFPQQQASLAMWDYHALVATVGRAFMDHRPLILSPDHIWLLICQGFAQHVNEHAEQLRHKLVNFSGKKDITIQRDDLVKGRLDNPWPDIFEVFSSQIHEHIGDTHNLVVAEFSTTGAVEKAAFEITLMDAVQKFFAYRVSTTCGIPTITLEGTTRDWQAILNRAQALREFDLEWWIDHLTPVLEQFVNASQGKVDHSFWQSIYKLESLGSGDANIHGWITLFFPYTNIGIRRELVPWQHGPCMPMLTDDFTSGMSRCPFTWNYYNQDFSMEFRAGFVGARQHPETLALRPEIGWVVVEKPSQPVVAVDAAPC